MSTDPHDIEDEESPQRGKRKAQMGLNQRRKNLTVLEDTSKKKSEKINHRLGENM